MNQKSKSLNTSSHFSTDKQPSSLSHFVEKMKWKIGCVFLCNPTSCPETSLLCLLTHKQESHNCRAVESAAGVDKQRLKGKLDLGNNNRGKGFKRRVVIILG